MAQRLAVAKFDLPEALTARLGRNDGRREV
jgi:hypothetical protein